jgi:hypothetical protein
MRQVYYCPNCRASIVYGEKFCGNCGTGLKWMVVKTPPPYQHESYDRQLTGQQAMQHLQYRQSGRQPDRQEKAGQKTAFPENRAQPGQQNTNDTGAPTSGKKRMPAEDPARVLRSEVSELLEHLFHKVE